MKFIKALAYLYFGITIGEFITQWRLDSRNVSFLSFLKEYWDNSARSYKLAKYAGALSVEDPEAGKAVFKTLLFPNRKI